MSTHGGIKLTSEKGKVRTGFVVILFAAALLILITLLFVFQRANGELGFIDSRVVSVVEYQAKLEYQQKFEAFSAVFDTRTRQFVDEKTAKRTVKPYGSSKEHRGMYLLVDVDEEGNVSSKWISP